VVCLCICLSLLVTFISRAKMAEPIEMSIGGRLMWIQGIMHLWTGSDPSREGAILGVVRLIENIGSHCRGVCDVLRPRARVVE